MVNTTTLCLYLWSILSIYCGNSFVINKSHGATRSLLHVKMSNNPRNPHNPLKNIDDEMMDILSKMNRLRLFSFQTPIFYIIFSK